MIRFLVLFLFPFFVAAQTIDAIAVIVEDEVITTYDIKQEMQLSHVDYDQARKILIRKKLESIEIKKRGISVSESEIYDEIRQLAQRNGMSISQFYDAVRESNGLNSSQLKEKIKERLLSQKLYQSIAMSKLKEPDEQEIKEYYTLHKERFAKPAFVDVIVYSASDRKLLEQKITNPMFYSASIMQQTQRLPSDRINPQLLGMLLQTGQGHFSPIVPNPQGGFMTFYVQKIAPVKEVSLDAVRMQIINAIMGEKRAEILDDYFAKLQDSVDIKEFKIKN